MEQYNKWKESLKGIVCTQVICKTCGGSEASKCGCAYKRYLENNSYNKWEESLKGMGHAQVICKTCGGSVAGKCKCAYKRYLVDEDKKKATNKDKKKGPNISSDNILEMWSDY